MTPLTPKNPTTSAEYIRKFRKDKGLVIREFAKELGMHEFTLIKWEGGRLPHRKYLKRLRCLVPGLPEAAKDQYGFGKNGRKLGKCKLLPRAAFKKQGFRRKREPNA